MKTGKSLTELAQEIERQAAAKRDFIAPVGKMEMAVDGESLQPILGLKSAETVTHFPVNDLAHGQIAEYVGIPRVYYQRMQNAAPMLLADNVNRWLHDDEHKKDKRMIRTLDGRVRSMHSNAYRPLDNQQLAEAVLPVLLEEGFLILSSEITERRLYIKAVDKRIERDVPTGRKIGDGSHVFFDTISPGIVIGNSEVGCGSLFLDRMRYTGMCTNMAIMGSVMRKYHTGTRAELSEEVYALLTDETKRATDVALWGQVRDLLKAALDEAKFDEDIKKLTQAAEQPIEGDVVEVMEVSGKRLGLVETERQGILRRLIEGGDLTRYGLHSAITRHSADVADYDRATELERMGGQVIEMSQQQYAQLLKAA